MKKRVYLETSVVSYLTSRPSRDLIVSAHQALTQEWWLTRDRYELYVSQLVLNEAANGDADAASLRLAAIESIPVLDLLPEAERLASRLVETVALPQKAQMMRIMWPSLRHKGLSTRD